MTSPATIRGEGSASNSGNRVALLTAGIATLLLLFLIYIGSRGLRDFDSALIGYAVATVVAFWRSRLSLHHLDQPPVYLALL